MHNDANKIQDSLLRWRQLLRQHIVFGIGFSIGEQIGRHAGLCRVGQLWCLVFLEWLNVHHDANQIQKQTVQRRKFVW
jgi:hypothetical protein